MTQNVTQTQLPSSILFICYLNAIRSPMAEGLMRDLVGDQIYVQSCGISKGKLDSLMVAVMKEKNIDMSAHDAKSLVDLQDGSFDMIIAFTEEAGMAAKSVFEGQDVTIETWPTPEPTAGQLDVRSMMNNYRAVRDNINAQLMRYFNL